ncbi:MAG: DUF1566 domain-containing protein [Desulfobacterales bacterium]|nr:MAG: DUF1566 domain-containing protein [Desulfobacterales bacterium]
MNIFSWRSPQKKDRTIAIKYTVLPLILLLFVLYSILFQPSSAAEDNPLSASQNDDVLAGIVNPFNSTCYDWRGKIIPCDLKRPYAELMFDKPLPDARFTDNKDGTLTDNLTQLVWLKNMNCLGMRDWHSAVLAAKSLEAGDCGPNLDLVLSDGSSAGDWRLPTMKELCTLIDFSRRDPALPIGHMFSDAPSGYHWSATTLDHHSEMAWIVYFESGTTCYEDVKNRAGYILPVRSLKE